MSEANRPEDSWTFADQTNAGEQGWALFPGDIAGYYVAVAEVGSSFNDDDEATLYVERLADAGDLLAIKAMRLIQAG